MTSAEKLEYIYQKGDDYGYSRGKIFIPDLLEILDYEYNFAELYFSNQIPKKGWWYKPLYNGSIIPVSKEPAFGRIQGRERGWFNQSRLDRTLSERGGPLIRSFFFYIIIFTFTLY